MTEIGSKMAEIAGLTLVLNLSILFFTPQCCKPWILEDSTDNCIIIPTISL